MTKVVREASRRPKLLAAPAVLGAVLAVSTPGVAATAVAATAPEATAPAARGTRELSVHLGVGAYGVLGQSTEVLFGTKMAVDGGYALTPHLWLDFGLGMTFGSCFNRSDEQDCIFIKGVAVEPNVGLEIKTAGSGRFLAYGRFVGGLVSITAERADGGTAAIVRAGGGLKGFITDNLALGIEATGVMGVGRIVTRPFAGGAGNAIVGFDLAFGTEIRF